MTDHDQAAVDAAERAARDVLDDLVTDLDAEMAATGSYDVDTLRTALTVAGRDALEAARSHLEAARQEREAQLPAVVYLMHHRFERGEEFGVFAAREDAETAAGRRREEGDPAALIEVIGCAVIGGKLAQAKAVEMAVAAERERCARLASEQAEDYERSFGVADGPETLGRLEAAHDALVSLAALLREGQAPGA